MPIDVQASDLPLVIVAFHGDVTMSESMAYTDKMDRLLAGGQKVGVITTTQGMGAVDRRVVEAQSAWFKRAAERLAKQMIGMGIVISSATSRFLLSSLFMATRLPMPYKVCDTEGEARTWLTQRFQQERLRVPAVLLRTV